MNPKNELLGRRKRKGIPLPSPQLFFFLFFTLLRGASFARVPVRLSVGRYIHTDTRTYLHSVWGNAGRNQNEVLPDERELASETIAFPEMNSKFVSFPCATNVMDSYLDPVGSAHIQTRSTIHTWTPSTTRAGFVEKKGEEVQKKCVFRLWKKTLKEDARNKNWPSATDPRFLLPFDVFF